VGEDFRPLLTDDQLDEIVDAERVTLRANYASSASKFSLSNPELASGDSDQAMKELFPDLSVHWR